MGKNGQIPTDEFAQRLQQALNKVNGNHAPDQNGSNPSSTSTLSGTGPGRQVGGPEPVGEAPAVVGVTATMAEGGSAPHAVQQDPLRTGPGPVGGGEHVVKQGECVSSIACNHGHFWETVWHDPGNAELREVRKDPYVLLPGDRVHVPPLRPKSETGQSEMRHRFRRKGQPEMFRVRVLIDDEPCGNEPYRLEVDGEVSEGVTDADGKVECPISPHARRALLRVGDDDVQEFVFELGELDPIDELSGVQGRLSNLGFGCWSRDGEWSAETEAAIRLFQQRHGLPETGEPDKATLARLKSEYGC